MSNNNSKKKDILKALSEGKSHDEIARKFHASKSTIQRVKKELQLRASAGETLIEVKDFEKRYGIKKPIKFELLAILTLATLIIFWSVLVVDKEITWNLVALSIMYILVSVYVFVGIWRHEH